MVIAQKRDGVFAGLIVSVCSLVSVLTLFCSSLHSAVSAS